MNEFTERKAKLNSFFRNVFEGGLGTGVLYGIALYTGVFEKFSPGLAKYGYECGAPLIIGMALLGFVLTMERKINTDSDVPKE